MKMWLLSCEVQSWGQTSQSDRSNRVVWETGFLDQLLMRSLLSGYSSKMPVLLNGVYLPCILRVGAFQKENMP